MARRRTSRLRAGSPSALLVVVLALGAGLAALARPAQAATFSNTTALTIADAACGTSSTDPSVPGTASL
jgi:hypothetical protein